MRRSTVLNQSLDRQRLSFATCRKCKKTFAVLGIEGQDVGHILYENGFRLPGATALEIEMECVSCYSWLYVYPPEPPSEWRQLLNELIYEELRY